jgi:hypothetical protein
MRRRCTGRESNNMSATTSVQHPYNEITVTRS